jgi:hypothetical protein
MSALRLYWGGCWALTLSHSPQRGLSGTVRMLTNTHTIIRLLIDLLALIQKTLELSGLQ